MESQEANALRESDASDSQPGTMQWAMDLELANRGLLKAVAREERLRAKTQLTEKQVEFFLQEASWALQGINAASVSLTAEVCSDLLRITRPTSDFSEVSDKFMLLLSSQDRSWPAFKVLLTQALLSDFPLLKARVRTVNAVELREEQLTAMLPIWKRYQSGTLALPCAGAELLVRFLSCCVEYKLKSETLARATRKLPTLQAKLKKQQSDIQSLKASIQRIQKYLTKSQHTVYWQDHSELDEKLSSDLTGLTSLDISKAVVIEERTIGVSYMRNGTASGGLMEKTGSPKVSIARESWATRDGSFPDFEAKMLYRERPQLPSDDEFEVEFEEHEIARFCGSKFFCM